MDADSQLLTRYALTRDAGAFTQLVRRHAAMVFSVAQRITRNHHDAEEVTQGCFMELARQAGAIHGSLAGWLHAAAAHRAANANRDRQRRYLREQAAAKSEIQIDGGWSEVAPLVDAALAQLPDELRLPAILYYLEGRAQAEIAAELGINQSTISRRLDAAVTALRTKLEAAGVTAPCVAILPASMAHNALVAMPKTLLAALGKLALAGVAPTATAVSGAAGGAGGAGLAGASSAGVKGGLEIGIKVVAALVLTAAVSMVGMNLLPGQKAIVATVAQAERQPSGAGAFSGALLNLAGIHSASFKMTETISTPGFDDKVKTGTVSVAEPAHERQVMPDAIIIKDDVAGKFLRLDPRHKMATLVNFTDLPAANEENAGLLEQWKRLAAGNFESLGEKEINGRAAIGYRAKLQGPTDAEPDTVWVDQETRRPLLVTEERKPPFTAGNTKGMSDFQWNVPYDEALFSLTPPPGYRVDSVSVPASNPTENDLLNILRITARLNKNAFLDHLDMKSVMKLVLTQAGTGSRSPHSNAAMKKWMVIVKGLSFTDEGSDWHYAGKGVLLNQPDTAIMWYKPKGSTSYRVIDADLTAHAVSPDQLPSKASDALSAPTKPSVLPKVLADMPGKVATAAQTAKRTAWLWVPWAGCATSFAIAGLLWLRQRRLQTAGAPLRGIQRQGRT